MTTIIISALLAVGAPAAAGAAPSGFTCTANDGVVRRFNIDLKRRRYDDGDGVKRLASVTDTKITLKGPNPDLVAGAGALGPVLSSLELDRNTFVLTDQTLTPIAA